MQIGCVYMQGLNFEPYFHLHAQNQKVLLPANFALPPCTSRDCYYSFKKFHHTLQYRALIVVGAEGALNPSILGNGCMHPSIFSHFSFNMHFFWFFSDFIYSHSQKFDFYDQNVCFICPPFTSHQFFAPVNWNSLRGPCCWCIYITLQSSH